MDDIKPITEIVYPDRGGYTGYSICIWDVSDRTGKTYLIGPWGCVAERSDLGDGNYILEGRFFVFGSLPERVLVIKNKLAQVEKISRNLISQWKPIMDEIVRKEDELWKDENRRHMYIDEVFSEEQKRRTRVKFWRLW